MANRKFGGRTWSPEDDFKVTTGKPWEGEPSGESYQGRRWDDSEGYKRGAQSEGSDDAAFLKVSQSETMARTSRVTNDIAGDVFADQGEGPYGAGGSSIRQVGGGGGKPRYPSNAGKKSNDSDGL